MDAFKKTPSFGMKAYVVLYSNKGIISKLIQWQSRGPFNHAAIVIAEEGCLGDVDRTSWKVARLWESEYSINTIGRDVEIKDFYNTAHWFEVTGDIDPFSLLEMGDWLDKQIGKKYDYQMVVRFVTRMQETNRSKGKWFCSELVTAALNKFGAPPFHPDRCEPWMVAPNLLALAPRLERRKNKELRQRFMALNARMK